MYDSIVIYKYVNRIHSLAPTSFKIDFSRLQYTYLIFIFLWNFKILPFPDFNRGASPKHPQFKELLSLYHNY